MEQKNAYGNWNVYAEVKADDDDDNFSIVKFYGTPALSCNHYEPQEMNVTPISSYSGTLLDYNQASDNGSAHTVLNSTKVNSVDFIKWTFYINGRGEAASIDVKAEKSGQSITLFSFVFTEDETFTYNWYLPVTEGMKLAYGDYYLNVYLSAGDDDDNISRAEVYGSPAPTFTTGGTLTAVNLAYNGTTSKQYSVSASNASSYTWYLDGSPNPTGASGANYTANITNLSHGNHTLKCVANGAGGTSTSTNQITFNVNKTPVISSGNLM